MTLAQVAADVQRLADAPDWEPEVTRIHDNYVAAVRQWMLLALAAAGLVVLVACANAANLMLTRSVARSQEMAIRASLGASRRQIVLAVLVEGLLLSLGATVISLLGCLAGVRVAKNSRHHRIAMDVPGIGDLTQRPGPRRRDSHRRRDRPAVLPRACMADGARAALESAQGQRNSHRDRPPALARRLPDRRDRNRRSCSSSSRGSSWRA